MHFPSVSYFLFLSSAKSCHWNFSRRRCDNRPRKPTRKLCRQRCAVHQRCASTHQHSTATAHPQHIDSSKEAQVGQARASPSHTHTLAAATATATATPTRTPTPMIISLAVRLPPHAPSLSRAATMLTRAMAKAGLLPQLQPPPVQPPMQPPVQPPPAQHATIAALVRRDPLTCIRALNTIFVWPGQLVWSAPAAHTAVDSPFDTRRSAEDIKKYDRSFGDQGHKTTMPFHEETTRLFTVALMEYLIEVRVRACDTWWCSTPDAPLGSMNASLPPFSFRTLTPGENFHRARALHCSVDPCLGFDTPNFHTLKFCTHCCKFLHTPPCNLRRSWLSAWVCP